MFLGNHEGVFLILPHFPTTKLQKKWEIQKTYGIFFILQQKKKNSGSEDFMSTLPELRVILIEKILLTGGLFGHELIELIE